MLRLSDFEYQLPDELIAQSPTEPRDASRLLVLNKEAGAIAHHHFYDLPDLLQPGDVLVRNNTQVIPARILGNKTSGGKVEVLLIKRSTLSAKEEIWECLTKPGLKPNQTIVFNEGFRATCRSINGYIRELAFNLAGEHLFEALHQIGQTPLPPYIQWSKTDEPELRQLYQTTYAKVAGSAAAPTAGLHFTPELDQRLRAADIQIEEVTLHVGLGTFLPVKDDDVTQHVMHQEWFELKPEVAQRLQQAKQDGRRIIAVGTTTCRVLETTKLQAQTGETGIYIHPPYRFTAIDGLITNFHLPKSTLLMILSALTSAPNTKQNFTNFGESTAGQAYQAAITERYRFYSFGDAMLIV